MRAVLAGFIAPALLALSFAAPAARAADDPALVARGAYLATAADCVACHTTPGGKPFTGGRAFVLPFGTLFSGNITPDHETGIGDWSDDDFVSAIHRGVGKDGVHLYPAFPYASFTAMSREDALAIKAYLFSLPAVHAPAKPNQIAFPFNLRFGMMFWNLLYNPDKRFTPDPARSAEWNRGNYLANALGHCAECHTPRDMLFGLQQDHQFAGTVLEGWKAYNITSDTRSGIGGWSDEALASFLSTGHADGHGIATGPMGEAIDDSLRHLTPQDIHALVTYLKSVPPQPGGASPSVNPDPPVLSQVAFGPGPAEPGASTLGLRIFEGFLRELS
ncbi:MAG: cytochrome c [Acetobacteraceae bacterium]